ncbi:MAG: LysR family transcriptional regulator, partial [Solirubrobacteraceae bacterium]|nr:LysR family transcriptional regulator [Solirubrobacteraceae bacterium]
MLDPSALRALIAVRDHGSVVGAAEALGFTPSAISQQIKRIERQTGSVMLEKVGRRVVLSERARQLATRGVRVLDELEALEHLAIGDDEALEGSLRVAAFSTSARGLLAPTLARLRTSAPKLELTLIELDPREALAAVERGTADVGLVHDWTTIPLTVPPALERHPLWLDQADVLGRDDHPVAGAAGESPPKVADDT